jgi:hypothetical protein
MKTRLCVSSCPSGQATYDATRKLCYNALTPGAATTTTAYTHLMYQAYDGDKITLDTATYADRFTAYSGQHLLGAGTSATILSKGI